MNFLRVIPDPTRPMLGWIARFLRIDSWPLNAKLSPESDGLVAPDQWRIQFTGPGPRDGDKEYGHIMSRYGGGFVAALDANRETVTEFLESLAKEPIDARIMSQGVAEAGKDSSLLLSAQDRVLRRTALLIGRRTERVFVYAESIIAMDRCPDELLNRLGHSSDPIGRIFTDHGLTFHREPLGDSTMGTSQAEGFAPLESAVVSRRYLVVPETMPVADVSEWFLQPAADAFFRAV